jgi:hypothetical protein
LVVAAISAVVPYCQEQRRLRNLMEFNAHRERGWPPLPYPFPEPPKRPETDVIL